MFSDMDLIEAKPSDLFNYFDKNKTNRFLLKCNGFNSEYFFITSNKTNIGAIASYNRDNVNKHVCVEILIDDFYNISHMKKAVLIYIKHIFIDNQQHKVYTRLIENENYLRDFWDNLGFADESILRDHILINSEYYNIKIMSILKHEFMRNANNAQIIEETLN